MSITRKFIPAVLAGVMILAPALPALAALEGLRERLQEQRTNIQERLQQRREARSGTTTPTERQEAAKERRQEAKQRLAEKRKQLIRAFFGRMAKRLEAALERQKKLGERIQARIEKARANGKDVTQAQAALDRARIVWQEAKDALESAKSRLEGVLSAEDPKTAFEEVKDLVAAARDKIKAVHAAFVDVITALKGIGQGGGQPTATTTP